LLFWMEKTRDAHNTALGTAVRQLRKRTSLTQQELGHRAGVPVEKLRQIEAGSIDADWGALRHLAYALEVELPEVFRLTEELLGD
jgi:transcriptional regulator with XRE-family HTH domain